MATITADLSREDQRPYFLWDEPYTIAEFRTALATAKPEEWHRLVGKLMREARDTDVWRFVEPKVVWAEFDRMRPYLGRRRAFWEYLLGAWHHDGVLG